MCLACSQVVRCSETALVFNLACSLNRVRKFRIVLPMYVAEQPRQEIHKVDHFALSQEFCPFWIKNKRPFSFGK